MPAGIFGASGTYSLGKGVLCVMDYRANDFKEQIARYQQELQRLQQKAVPAVAAPPAVQNSTPTPPPTPQEFTAPFSVRVTAAGGAVPIEGARVTVASQNGEVLQTRLTDQSGLTEVMVLPAVDPALTLTPEPSFIPILYEILVAAPGYYRVRTVGVPLYGGIPTQLPITLIPLPEFDDGSSEQTNFVTPPTGL